MADALSPELQNILAQMPQLASNTQTQPDNQGILGNLPFSLFGGNINPNTNMNIGNLPLQQKGTIDVRNMQPYQTRSWPQPQQSMTPPGAPTMMPPVGELPVHSQPSTPIPATAAPTPQTPDVSPITAPPLQLATGAAPRLSYNPQASSSPTTHATPNWDALMKGATNQVNQAKTQEYQPFGKSILGQIGNVVTKPFQVIGDIRDMLSGAPTTFQRQQALYSQPGLAEDIANKTLQAQAMAQMTPMQIQEHMQRLLGEQIKTSNMQKEIDTRTGLEQAQAKHLGNVDTNMANVNAIKQQVADTGTAKVSAGAEKAKAKTKLDEWRTKKTTLQSYINNLTSNSVMSPKLEADLKKAKADMEKLNLEKPTGDSANTPAEESGDVSGKVSGKVGKYSYSE